MDIWDLAIRLTAIVSLMLGCAGWQRATDELKLRRRTEREVDDLLVKLEERDAEVGELRAENAELRELGRTLAGRNARLEHSCNRGTRVMMFSQN